MVHGGHCLKWLQRPPARIHNEFQTNHHHWPYPQASWPRDPEQKRFQSPASPLHCAMHRWLKPNEKMRNILATYFRSWWNKNAKMAYTNIDHEHINVLWIREITSTMDNPKGHVFWTKYTRRRVPMFEMFFGKLWVSEVSGDIVLDYLLIQLKLLFEFSYNSILLLRTWCVWVFLYVPIFLFFSIDCGKCDILKTIRTCWNLHFM